MAVLRIISGSSAYFASPVSNASFPQMPDSWGGWDNACLREVIERRADEF
jgi:hypothetical protein